MRRMRDITVRVVKEGETAKKREVKEERVYEHMVVH